MLVAHDQNMVLDESLVDRGTGVGVDRPGEIKPGDFGAGMIAERRDGEGRHGVFPPRSCFVGNAIAARQEGQAAVRDDFDMTSRPDATSKHHCRRETLLKTDYGSSANTEDHR
jgi:hypothetical protein